MGPGDDCPPHLVRYPTAAAISKLCERFQLANDPYSQDWEVEVADAARVDEFLGVYGDASFTDDDRFLLMQLVVASLDEALHAGDVIDATWARASSILLDAAPLHASTLSYWACGDDPDPDHQFFITRFIRPLWLQVRRDPAVLFLP